MKLSFDATGASLTGVTVPTTVATAETVPSVIVYVNERRAVVVRRRREHQLARDQLDTMPLVTRPQDHQS